MFWKLFGCVVIYSTLLITNVRGDAAKIRGDIQLVYTKWMELAQADQLTAENNANNENKTLKAYSEEIRIIQEKMKRVYRDDIQRAMENLLFEVESLTDGNEKAELRNSLKSQLAYPMSLCDKFKQAAGIVPPPQPQAALESSKISTSVSGGSSSSPPPPRRRSSRLSRAESKKIERACQRDYSNEDEEDACISRREKRLKRQKSKRRRRY